MEREQRNSFRILMPPGQGEAVVLLGRKQVTVRLVDTSAGGFALAASQKLPIAVGETLRLATTSGGHEVRVVRLESYADGVLLGVERIRDLDDKAMAGNGNAGRKSSSAMGSLALVSLALAAAAITMANYKPSRAERPGPAMPQQVFAGFFPQDRAGHEPSIERTQPPAETAPQALDQRAR